MDNEKLAFYEDYSTEIVEVERDKNGFRQFIHKDNGCNHSIISEDSWKRSYEFMQNKAFAILRAYLTRDKNGKLLTKKENIARNRKLRAKLNQNKLGVHILVGHYKYADGTPGVERSYLVVKPDEMNTGVFVKLITECLNIDGEIQESAILHAPNKFPDYYVIHYDNTFEKIGTKLTLNKIGDNYSQHVLKLDCPFVFEGMETPSKGTLAWDRANIFYKPGQKFIES